MISVRDIAWAAGFLEGEGSFAWTGSPQVTAAQVQREPLDRLVALFGGSLRLRQTRGFSTKPIWVWSLPSRRSAEVMFTIYTLMSPARKAQIERALSKWRVARILKARRSTICRVGHSVTGPNALMQNGYAKCRACSNANRRARRTKLKEQRAEV